MDIFTRVAIAIVADPISTGVMLATAALARRYWQILVAVAAWIAISTQIAQRTHSYQIVAWLIVATISYALFNFFRNRSKNKLRQDNPIDDTSTSPPEPTDEDYATAMIEAQGSDRKSGPWARAFADANGDENFARAIYTKRRALEIAGARISPTAKTTDKDKSIPQPPTTARHPLKPGEGYCPNCGNPSAIDAKKCHSCGSQFIGDYKPKGT